jgi:hypothetical protein
MKSLGSLRFLAHVVLTILMLGFFVAQSHAQSGGPGGPGATGGGAGGAGGGAHLNPNPTDSVDADVSAVSEAAQQAIDVCDRPKHSTECIADALDKYASALQRLAPFLPAKFRNLSDVVARAARRVRAARTRNEAIGAIANAIAEVHKTIVLLKADDPTVRKTRDGELVVETLQVASDKLQRAVGL